MRTSYILPSLAAVVLAAANPSPAHAQLGALRERAKKAAADAAGNKLPARPDANASSATPATGPAPASSRVTYNDRVIEMTPDVVDRLALALNTEVMVSDSLKAILPTLREPKDWEACRTTWTTSAEAKSFYERMQQINTSDRAVMLKFTNDMSAAIEKSCGREPLAARQEVQSQLRTLPGERAMRVGNFTRAQYVILRERVTPLCTLEAAAAADGGQRVRGIGANIYYVYGAGEVEALRPKCSVLMPRITATG